MKRAILVHGWGGNPEEGWRPWLRQNLEKSGWQVINPAMPESDTPTQDAWLTKLVEVIGEPDGETYLVGHSLGAITILRYLEGLSGDQHIGGAVFIAGFANNLTFDGYKGELDSFFTAPVDWGVVNDRCHQFFVLHSQDDTWVDESNYHELKAELNGKSELQNGFKHYSGDDGIKEIEPVSKALQDMSVN